MTILCTLLLSSPIYYYIILSSRFDEYNRSEYEISRNWDEWGGGGCNDIFYCCAIQGERKNKKNTRARIRARTHTRSSPARRRQRATAAIRQRRVTAPHVTTGRLHKKHNNNNKRASRRRRRRA